MQFVKKIILIIAVGLGVLPLFAQDERIHNDANIEELMQKAELYAQHKHYSKTIELALQAHRQATLDFNKEVKLSAANLLTNAYRISGNIPLAFFYLNESDMLRQNIKQQKYLQEVNRLRISYNTLKKEDRIHRLTNEIKEQKLALFQLRQMIVIAGVFAFLLLASVVLSHWKTAV